MDDDAWIRLHFPEHYVGTAVEVGAYDGISMSPTFGLERRGWRVLSIEANPAHKEVLRHNRREIWMGACASTEGEATLNVHTTNPMAYTTLSKAFSHDVWRPAADAKWDEVQVQALRLDSVLEAFHFDALDVVAIDTEGTELDVLKGFSLDRWRPKCVIVESWHEKSPVVEWMAKYGYTRVDRALVNDRFLRDE